MPKTIDFPTFASDFEARIQRFARLAPLAGVTDAATAGIAARAEKIRSAIEIGFEGGVSGDISKDDMAALVELGTKFDRLADQAEAGFCRGETVSAPFDERILTDVLAGADCPRLLQLGRILTGDAAGISRRDLAALDASLGGMEFGIGPQLITFLKVLILLILLILAKLGVVSRDLASKVAELLYAIDQRISGGLEVIGIQPRKRTETVNNGQPLFIGVPRERTFQFSLKDVSIMGDPNARVDVLTDTGRKVFEFNALDQSIIFSGPVNVQFVLVTSDPRGTATIEICVLR